MSNNTQEFTRLYPTTSNSNLAKRFNINIQSIKNKAHRLGLVKSGILSKDNKQKEVAMATKKTSLKKVRQTVKNEEKQRATVQNLKEALKYIDELEVKVKAKSLLQNSTKVHTIKPSPRHSNDEATAVACLSDVHIGERFSSDQTNGMNEYSIDIAKARLDQYFTNILKLVEKERQKVKIDNLVLFLGGDIIDGALHLDTIMSGETSQPMKQAVIAQACIEAGLRYLEPHFKKITVICKDGNHGRITNRMHHASRTGNSLEWFMFFNLAERLPQFTWINEQSLHTYMTFYQGCKGEKTIRFHHGDTISFGGVNGPYTYLNRRRYQWNAGRRADVDVIGHLHMYRVNPNGWILNGSVVGYNPFAVSLGAEFERPQQAFFLVDKDKGITVNIAILFTV